MLDIISFNKPYLSGKETDYIIEAVNSYKISGNGMFTQKCHRFFEQRYGFKKVLLTTSCTDALEMCSLLLNISPGDEVIIPSYTFVSTANPFILRGAKVVFADSETNHPNIDAAKIEALITSRTKAIVVVHYAGVACDMDEIKAIADRHKLYVIEDAAQAIDANYKGIPLGSIGHLAAFSFHETKNIISGEGGMLVVNDDRFIERAEIIWEKGTNRAAFFRGEVNKYGWVDVGSSFLPSEIISAFLYAQLEKLDDIQQKRKRIWNTYYEKLKFLEVKELLKLPVVHDYASDNAHMFYIVCRSLEERTALIKHLKDGKVQAVFHYLSLHSSEFYYQHHDGRRLPNCDAFSDTLVRLPFFYELKEEQVDYICGCIIDFYNN